MAALVRFNDGQSRGDVPASHIGAGAGKFRQTLLDSWPVTRPIRAEISWIVATSGEKHRPGNA